ncbi:hypothetical protein [Jiangella ureilytica]|uniref:hypothetical protein n=1 Tax=Jiangella ureilytica TaxID=2530374 RepID=UPI00193D53FA|nr:hypothetical protein [Jiangella ureilytica]
MNTATRVAAAAATGYVLGRRKKLKLAIAVGSMLAGKRLATDPRGMLRQANELIESRPELAEISDQVRTTLFTAARGAAVGVVSSRINAVSDSIRDRSDRLTGAVTDKVPLDQSGAEDDRAEDDQQEEPQQEEPQQEEPQQEEPPRKNESDAAPARKPRRGRRDSAEESSEEQDRPRKSTAKKAPAKKSAASEGDAARKRAPAKKTAKKTAAKKSASSGRSRSGTRG